MESKKVLLSKQQTGTLVEALKFQKVKQRFRSCYGAFSLNSRADPTLGATWK